MARWVAAVPERESVSVLLILNDAPYGGERTYNALRLALALLKTEPQGQATV